MGNGYVCVVFSTMVIIKGVFNIWGILGRNVLEFLGYVFLNVEFFIGYYVDNESGYFDL